MTSNLVDLPVEPCDAVDNDCDGRTDEGDVTPPTIVLPDDIDIVQQSGQPCPDHVVSYSQPTATDNCGLRWGPLWTNEGLPSGASFPVGVTQTCFEAMDNTGNYARDCFDVTYTSALPVGEPDLCDGVDNDCDQTTDEDPDVTPPIITCPDNIAIVQQVGEPCPDHVVNYALPTVSDNCGAIDSMSLQSGQESGTSFRRGMTTTNCYRAWDISGNSAECCFNVTYTSLWPRNRGETFCDGIDNDCDESTDEDWPPDWPCSTGLLGECQYGYKKCEADLSISCEPLSPASSEPDTCNWPDYNCDGVLVTTPSECLNPGGQVLWGMMNVPGPSGGLKAFRCFVAQAGAVPVCDTDNGLLKAYPPMCQ